MSDDNVIVVRIGFECHECGANAWRVWTSRKRIGYIKRVRECKSCKAHIETQEIMIKK